MRWVTSVSLVFLCLTRIVWADIIEVDFRGRRGGVTVDTRTGLEWLDIPITHDMSVNQIVSLTRPGMQFDGFRHARLSEFEILFLHLGLTTSLAQASSPIAVEPTAWGAISRLGSGGVARGQFDDEGDPAKTGEMYLSGGSVHVRRRDTFLSFQHESDLGHWLVRAFQGDIESLVPRRPYGDATQDGRFNQHDLIQILTAGFYGTGKFGASWPTGDFNGDGFADQQDLVKALQGGVYQAGRMPAHAIPEPSSLALMAMAALCRLIVHRFRRILDG